MAWPRTQNTTSSPRTRGPIRRVAAALKGLRSMSLFHLGRRWLWVPAFAGTTMKISNGHSQRLPFTQRLGVTRRHVGIFGVVADGRKDFPRPSAFDAGGLFDDHGDAGHLVEPKRTGRRVLVGHHRIRGDADFRQIDIEQRVENL